MHVHTEEGEWPGPTIEFRAMQERNRRLSGLAVRKDGPGSPSLGVNQRKRSIPDRQHMHLNARIESLTRIGRHQQKATMRVGLVRGLFTKISFPVA
jgi:hypothetical protein